jgi:hypothetical protein
MQFIIKVRKKEGYNSFYNSHPDEVMGALLGLSAEIVNISSDEKAFYIIVNSEESKIKRVENFCRNHVSLYDRMWGIKELKKEFEEGKINKKKFDEKMKEMSDPIDITIIEPIDMGLTTQDKRDDKLTDLLKN